MVIPENTQETNPNDPPSFENVNNNPPPPPTPNSPHVHVHYSNNPVPKFSGNDDEFGTWKARMLLHITGIERNMLKILNEGPYIPRSPLNPLLDPTGSRSGREKREEHWSEEDKRLVNLDTILKNMILGAVPETLIPT